VFRAVIVGVRASHGIIFYTSDLIKIDEILFFFLKFTFATLTARLSEIIARAVAADGFVGGGDDSEHVRAGLLRCGQLEVEDLL
jgi:hypothetical protein